MPEKERQSIVSPLPPRRCPECGAMAVYRETIDYRTGFKYEGHLHEFEVHGISVNKCRDCGHIGLPNTALDEITEAFRSHVNLLTAEEIRQRLEALRLTQKDFAELLGVAQETVSRWLTNVQIQTRSLDRLMRLFFKSPELRKELAEMNGAGTVSGEQTPSGNRAASVHGRIQNGVVVLQPDASLPEGAEVTVVVG